MKKWFLLLTPFILYALGGVMNVLVISVNHGTMPVVVPASFAASAADHGIDLSPGDLIDDSHAVMQSSDHLKWLADWIQIPDLGTASPGDLLLWFGAWAQSYAVGIWLGITFLVKQ